MNEIIKKQNKQNHTSHFTPHTSKRGITLIALVITIIVMLILVAVTISIAVNGGLFGYAGKATSETKNAIEDEKGLGSGYLETTIDGHTFSSIEEINQYFENGIVPVTTDDILGFIEDDDICRDWMALEFTEKLKWMGDYSGNYGDSEWNYSPVYRCSLDNKIYIVGTEDGQNEGEVEILDWDGTPEYGNDGYPNTLTMQFGTYTRGTTHHIGEGEFDLQYSPGGDGAIDSIFIYPPFNDYCILHYTVNGWLIDVEWKD